MMTARRGNIAIKTIVFILVIALLLAVYFSSDSEPGPVRITVSKETTHILGPVNEDGTVNYMAYLNAKHSKGVTKENNTAIPLIEIFGPNLLRKETGREICKILTIEFPSEDKKYFTDMNYSSDKEKEALYDNLTKATSKPWNAGQYPMIAEWLETNNEALNATLVAVQRTGYYMPGVSYDADSSVATLSQSSMNACMDMGDALIARAMLKLDSGDVPETWADLMTARHLARRIGSGYTLFERLLALAIEVRTCSAIRGMAGSGKLTDTQARVFLADMQRLEPLPDLVDTIDETERFAMLDCVMGMARTARLKGFAKALRDLTSREQSAGSLNWDKMLRTMNPRYDSLVAAARQKTFKARTEALAAHNRRAEEFSAELEKSRSSLKSLWKRSHDPSEMIGNSMITMLMPSLGKTVVLRDRGTAQGELSVVAMALAAYRAEKKAYPDKLAELAPGYLKKVPDDLFIDKPFGYKRTDKGYLLYSVGENMKYDGPKKEDDTDDENDDIVVRVE